MRTSVRRSEKGFTLIELGIVVAVIAILATVVLFGRGFLTSAGTSKGIEAINSIRKAAATYNGVTGGNGAMDAADCLNDLAERELLPPAALTASQPWVVGGVTISSCTITGGTNLNVVVDPGDGTTAADMQTAVGDGGKQTGCATAFGIAGSVLTMCFAL